MKEEEIKARTLVLSYLPIVTHESFNDLEDKKNKLYASGKIKEAHEVQAELDFLYFGIK